MLNRLFIFYFLSLFFINPVYAQQQDIFVEDLSEEELTELRSEMGTIPTAGSNLTDDKLVSCFDYYKFNSVSVSVISNLQGTVPGAPINFSGVIKNENPYPTVDGSFYVKIFKLRDSKDKNQNGMPVVDQFVVKSKIALSANSEIPMEFEWNVPAWAESGTYQMATFFVSRGRYNLSGLSFTDDVVGNTVLFDVISDMKEGLVTLDKDTVKINKTPYAFAAFPPRVGKDEPIEISFNILNNTKQSGVIPVSYKVYSWDSMEPVTNAVLSEVKDVSVPAGKKTPVSFILEDTDHPVYLIEISIQYGDTKSILNIRVVREGIDKLRINFPSTATYPLIAGEKATIFSCLHNISESVEDGKLKLTLFDDSGNEIHSYEYEGKVDGKMVGVMDEFIPKKSMATFSLRAELFQNGDLVDDVTMWYKCEEFNTCDLPEESSPKKLSNYLILILSAIVVLSVSAVIFKKSSHNNLN